MKKSILIFSLLLAAPLSFLQAAEPILKAGDHVAIIGDSITEQKIYSRNIEVYLLACSGIENLEVAQFGWGGETAEAFTRRCARSVGWFKPTVATTCYGMNDGRYTAYSEAIGKPYHDNLAKCVDLLKQAGVQRVVLSSPGVVDSTYFKRAGATAAVYNDNLAHLRDLAKAVAQEKNVGFADTHQAMLTAMVKAKAALGENYDVAGMDGVHPGANGHLLMAASILSALGCDGEIARITFTVGGAPQASAGQKILKAEGSAVEVESTRWPFLLQGGNTRTVVPYTDFVERLDRFVVVMADCPWPRAKITWGSKSVVLDGAKLKQGVNLMEVFEVTPFDSAEGALVQAVQAKQELETFLVKGLLCAPGLNLIESDSESKELMGKLIDRQIQLRASRLAAVHAVLVPVRYHLAVGPAENP